MKTLKHSCKTFLFTYLLVMCNYGYGKTVFVANHANDGVSAYKIEGDQLEFQKTIDLPTNGWGPSDITIDPTSEILFVTNENSTAGGGNVIELIQARTFLRAGTITLTHTNAPTNVTGIVVDNNDPNNPKVYLTDRNTKNLYTYDWDSEELTMTLQVPDPNDPNDPDYVPNPIELDDIDYACGLALDEEEGLLYVSDYLYNTGFSQYVYVYDRDNDWEHVKTIDMGENVVGIALDDPNEYLYGGVYYGHNYLIKYDLSISDPNNVDPNDTYDIGARAIGIDVDQDSELVYVSTINSNSVAQIQVWDTELPFDLGWSMTDSETQGLDGPAGVCVSDTEYVPPFGITKIDDVNDCVTPRPEEEITYTICYEYDWDEAGDPNITDFTSIYIEDFLPNEVDFVSADPNEGYYDSDSHSYVWTIDANSIGDPNCIDITVEINNKVTPNTSIVNSVVEIVSDINNQTYTDEATVNTLICSCGENGTIIYVDEDATSGSESGASWANAYLTIEDALDNAFPCDEIWVAEGTYNPTEEPDLVNFVGLYGGFYGDETKRNERDWADYYTIICADPNNNDDLTKDFDDPNRMIADNLDYALVANDWIRWTVVDGFIIRRAKTANIYCSADSLLIEHNEIIDSPKGIYCDDSNDIFVRNNFIYENEQGMYLSGAQEEALIINNTFADNSKAINLTSGVEPLIKNCIFWDNDANDMVGCYATYSCIENTIDLYDETDPNIYLGIGEGNITGEPNEPDFVSGGYHLSSTSPCIDAGDPNGTYTFQRDIDKEFRFIGEEVDMGADEYCDCNDVSDADFNSDDIVNFPDFAEFSVVWLLDDNDPNWDTSTETYDLVDDQVIDINDLVTFAEEWLWLSCDEMKEIDLGDDTSIEESYSKTMSSKMSESMLLSAKKEPTLKEQIDNAEYLAKFLEKIWKEDEELRKTIDEKDWEEFMKSVYGWLDDLENEFYSKE